MTQMHRQCQRTAPGNGVLGEVQVQRPSVIVTSCALAAVDNNANAAPNRTVAGRIHPPLHIER